MLVFRIKMALPSGPNGLLHAIDQFRIHMLVNPAIYQHGFIFQRGLTSALELEYETHFCRFLMPTICGADTGSKKRYAGLIQEGDKQRMVFKGLETVRTDWTPLAQQFQQELYLRIFRNEPYQEYIRETIDKLGGGRSGCRRRSTG